MTHYHNHMVAMTGKGKLIPIKSDEEVMADYYAKQQKTNKKPTGSKPYKKPTESKPYKKPTESKPYKKPTGSKPYKKSTETKPYKKPIESKTFKKTTESPPLPKNNQGEDLSGYNKQGLKDLGIKRGFDTTNFKLKDDYLKLLGK